MRTTLLTALCLFSCSAKEVRPTPASSFACRYETKRWTVQELELSASPYHSTWGTTVAHRPAAAWLKLPYGEPEQGFAVRLTQQNVHLAAHAHAPNGLQLFSRQPHAVGTVLTYEKGARMLLQKSEPGAMTAELEKPRYFAPFASRVVQVRCEDTQINPHYPPVKYRPARSTDGGTHDVLGSNDGGMFTTTDGGSIFADEVEDELPQNGGEERWAFAWDLDIPVAATPGGAPEGNLNFPKPKHQDPLPMMATVLQEQEEHTLVEFHSFPTRVKGWIPRSALVQVPAQSFGVGGLGLIGGAGTPPPERVRCAQAVTLFVLRPGGYQKVGQLLPGAAYEVGQAVEGFTVLELPELSAVKLVAPGKWAVRSADLSRCLGPAPRL